MGLLKRAIDRQQKASVTFNGSQSVFPALVQTNSQDFRIQVVDSSGSRFNTSFTAVDCAAFGLRMVIGIAPVGDEDIDPLAATFEDGWTWDSGESCFNGTINLNTQGITDLIGQAESVLAWIEITLTIGGIPETVFQGRITILAAMDKLGSPTPVPLETFLTASQTDATYLRKIMPDANFRYKDGQLQFWDATAFADDASKPWRALGVEDGNTVWSDPIDD